MNYNTSRNIDVWDSLYSNNYSIMEYPNDAYIRASYRLLDPQKNNKLLEIGFGSGADMLHNLKRGFECSGAEVSQEAIEITKKRVEEAGFNVDLRKIEGNGILPFQDEEFDIVVAWQVLCYNNWDTFTTMRNEIDRVLRPNGIFLGTMTATGDISHQQSKKIDEYLYESQVSGQEGAVMIIVDKEMLSHCFPNKEIQIGSYSYDFQGRQSKHWIVSYEK